MNNSNRMPMMPMPMMMKNSLHIEVPFTILFSEWKVDSTTDAILSCLLLMFISFLYECLKHCRSNINSSISKILEDEKRLTTIRTMGKVDTYQNEDGCHCLSADDKRSTIRISEADKSKLSSVKRYIYSSAILLHWITCVIYGFEMFISLALMLSAMSFHTGVIFSIVFGGVLGKIVLLWPRKTTSLRHANEIEEDGCH